MRLLAAHGLRPDTDLGQHFLLDENLVDLAVREAAIGPRRRRAGGRAPASACSPSRSRAAAATVHAVELDRRLEAALADALTGCGNVVVHWGDAMRLPLGDLAPPPTALVSNLPYDIATPAAAREPLGPARARALVRDGPARGGRPLAGAARQPALRRALGADAARPWRRPSAASVGREVFVPRPRVDSALVAFRRDRPGARRRACAAWCGRPSRRAARRSSTPSPWPAPTARRWRRRSPRSGIRRRVRPEALAAGRLPAARGGPRVDRLTLAAPAKINLRLLVGPRRADGYHPLSEPDGGPRRAGRHGPGGARRHAARWRARASRARRTSPGGRSTPSRPRSAARCPLAVVIDKAHPGPGGPRRGLERRGRRAASPPTGSTGSASAPERLEAVGRAGRLGRAVLHPGRLPVGRGARGASCARRARRAFAALLVTPAGRALPTGRASTRAFDRGPAPPPGRRRRARPPDARPSPRGCATTSGRRPSPSRPPSARPPARSPPRARAPLLLCGSGSCVAGLFADRAGAEAAAGRLAGAIVVTPRGPA